MKSDKRKIDTLTLLVGEHEALKLGTQVADLLAELVELQPYFKTMLDRAEAETPSKLTPFLRLIEVYVGSFKEALAATPEVVEMIEQTRRQRQVNAILGEGME